MLRTTVFPKRNFYLKPAFWGVDRDLREVMESIENVWEGGGINNLSPDYKETDNAYFISIDLPGVSKSSLDLQVEGEQIALTATRKSRFSEEGELEQKISRTILMPKHVDKEKIQAHCEDGVLYLALPKLEKARPQKITISEGFSDSRWNKLLSDKKKESEINT